MHLAPGGSFPTETLALRSRPDAVAAVDAAAGQQGRAHVRDVIHGCLGTRRGGAAVRQERRSEKLTAQAQLFWTPRVVPAVAESARADDQPTRTPALVALKQ